MQLLSQKQFQRLSNEIDKGIINQRSMHFFGHLDQQNQAAESQDSLSLNSYRGIFSERKVKQIQIILIPKKSRSKLIMLQQKLQLLKQLISTYLNVKVLNSSAKPFLFYKYITSDIVTTPFPLKRNKNGLQAIPLLKHLKNYYKKKQTKLLAIIQSALVQKNNQIDGRALGNAGVAVVSLDKDFTITTATAIHQTLHLFGLGHCRLWSCLMNPITNKESHLCPCCLLKLRVRTEFDTKSRYQAIAKLMKRLQMDQGYIKAEALAQTC